MWQMQMFQLRRMMSGVLALALQGALVGMAPISGVPNGPQSIPEDYQTLVSPDQQGIIIQENVPWPAIIPVPPPIPTPVRGEQAEKRR